MKEYVVFDFCVGGVHKNFIYFGVQDPCAPSRVILGKTKQGGGDFKMCLLLLYWLFYHILVQEIICIMNVGIGELVRDARLYKGLTQKELVERSTPTVYILLRIGEALGLRLRIS